MGYPNDCGEVFESLRQNKGSSVTLLGCWRVFNLFLIFLFLFFSLMPILLLYS